MLVDANGVLVGVIGFELRGGGGALIGDIRIGRADGERTIDPTGRMLPVEISVPGKQAGAGKSL